VAVVGVALQVALATLPDVLEASVAKSVAHSAVPVEGLLREDLPQRKTNPTITQPPATRRPFVLSLLEVWRK
jgi:hypothetical protein